MNTLNNPNQLIMSECPIEARVAIFAAACLLTEKLYVIARRF
jgi:hypothetical protein